MSRHHCPDVQGSLLCPDGATLLLSTPGRPDARRGLTIFVTEFAGEPDRCWRRGAVIDPGPAGYSDLAVLDDDRIGILHQTGEAAADERIRFAVRGLATLAPSAGR